MIVSLPDVLPENKNSFTCCVFLKLKNLKQISFNGDRDVSGHVDVYDGNWHHYAVTRTSGKDIRVYMDGRLAGIAEAKGGPYIKPYGEIYLCGRGDQDEDRFFGGMLMKLSIFDQVFNDTEIIAKWAIEYDEVFKPKPPPPPANKECSSIPAEKDCNGNCFNDFYTAWIGDGICDDGYFGHTFNFITNSYDRINFNCGKGSTVQTKFDGGDCDKTLPLKKVTVDPVIYFPFDDAIDTKVNNITTSKGMAERRERERENQT